MSVDTLNKLLGNPPDNNCCKGVGGDKHVDECLRVERIVK